MKALKNILLVGMLIILIASCERREQGKNTRPVSPPHAEIISVKMPDTEMVNEPIFIEVTVTNNGGDAKAGDISVSFSNNTQVSIIEADTTKATVYPVGSQIWSNTEKKTIPSKYLLVEAWQEPWKANDTHRLKLKVIPFTVGTIRILVRATMTVPKDKGRIIATPETGPLDQQGFPVQEYATTVVAQPQYQSETLGNVLAENGIDLRNIDTSELNQKIKSYSVLNDEKMFCIAGYLDDGLCIYLLRKEQNKWIHRTLDENELPPGYLTGIDYFKNYIHLSFHLNPSAEFTLILSNDLEPHHLGGWVLAIFDDETIVSHNFQVHFSPLHHAGISIYNPHIKQGQQIFPMEPYQEFRLEHIKKVKAFYEKHSIDMDPESFNADLSDGEVVINNSTHSLAFVITYDHQYLNYWNDKNIEVPQDPGFTEVVYIYRNVNNIEEITYKEIPLSDLKERYGDIPISEYLKPERLNEIFK